MSNVERAMVGNAEMYWEPDVRLARLRFTRETQATGRDAAGLVGMLERWIGTGGERFGLLGDGGNLSGVDAEYRLVWRKFLRDHREVCRIAFFNMKPVIRIAADMFRIGSGVKLKAFADEKDARTWLREQGILA